jgi:putative methionine-R-sulfoxide reductase with GAF domain
MFQFDIDRRGAKAELYRDLLSAIDAITADEPDPIANMANAAAVIWEYLPDLNWAGFYRQARRNWWCRSCMRAHCSACSISTARSSAGSTRRTLPVAKRWRHCSLRGFPRPPDPHRDRF